MAPCTISGRDGRESQLFKSSPAGEGASSSTSASVDASTVPATGAGNRLAHLTVFLPL